MAKLYTILGLDYLINLDKVAKISREKDKMIEFIFSNHNIKSVVIKFETKSTRDRTYAKIRKSLVSKEWWNQ